MISQAIAELPVDITDADLNHLHKLLINAWSAEYSLNITPIVNDRQYLEQTLRWTLPQAYYATLFSFRAVLMADGENLANQDLLQGRAETFAQQGGYGPTHKNLLAALRIYAHTSSGPAVEIPEHVIPEIQNLLMIVTGKAMLAHEWVIYQKIGHAAYVSLVTKAPEYLQRLVRGRLQTLMTEKEVLAA